jgi:hypothetical protein
MAHCPYDKLADLEPVVDSVRGWPGIKEKSPGVFYLKSTPFLHFHEKDGARWADARDGKNWGEPIEVPFKATKAVREKFHKEVRRRYEGMVKP